MSVDKTINEIDDDLAKLLLCGGETPINWMELEFVTIVKRLDETRDKVTDVWFDWVWRAMRCEEFTENLYVAGLNVVLPVFKSIVKGLEVLLNFILVPLLLMLETTKLWHEHINSKFDDRMDKITELKKVIREERKELEGEKQ